MRTMLTKRTLDTLPARSQRYEKTEASGLRVRVYPSGRKTYIYRYRDPGGTQRVIKLGEWPGVALVEARRRLAEAKADRQRGIDPAEKLVAERKARREQYQARLTAPTVMDILDEYMLRHVEPNCRPATIAEFKRLIETNLKPVFNHMRAAELTRSNVVAALDDIVDGATPSVADHAGNVLRSAYSFAVARGRLEHNPCQKLPKYAKETRRERVLTKSEIKHLWSALDNYKGVSEPLALGFKLLLLTGQRRGALAVAEWVEFSEDQWVIPASHAKTEQTQLVPLSPLAQEIIVRLRKLTGKTPWVLPNPSLNGPIKPQALTRGLARLRGNADYTVHDLRRTAATLMAEAGVSRFVIARVLGHADEAITGIYDRHEYQPEKRRALEVLSRKVGETIGRPEIAEVVSLR